MLSKLLTVFEEVTAKIPDQRKHGPNLKYKLPDVIKTAFSIFFCQSESILNYMRVQESEYYNGNAQNIFGLSGKIPSDNQIRNILDEIDPHLFKELFYNMNQLPETGETLNKYKGTGVLADQTLVAIDGFTYHSSEKIKCEHCLHKTTIKKTEDEEGNKIKEETTIYYHTALVGVIARPSCNDVIPLMPEFIRNEDGMKKQDCEINAAKRWITIHAEKLRELKAVILGDGLYSKVPFCKLLREEGLSFLLTCKPDDHKTLFEYAIPKLMEEVVVIRDEYRYVYQFINRIPLKDEKDNEDEFLVNFMSLKIYKGKKYRYRSSWITDKEITRENVAYLVNSARTRWKIENEHNNVLTNRGYNLKHNFGHGKKYLNENLFILNLLAYGFHTILKIVDELYQKVWEAMKARYSFFEIIRGAIKFKVFNSWNDCLTFILKNRVVREKRPYRRKNKMGKYKLKGMPP